MLFCVLWDLGKKIEIKEGDSLTYNCRWQFWLQSHDNFGYRWTTALAGYQKAGVCTPLWICNCANLGLSYST
jgi:hypothetical protein